MPLEQLPIIGDWIDPLTIVRVQLRAGRKDAFGEVMPGVIITTRDGIHLDITCDLGDEHARKLRDEIAGWRNAAEAALAEPQPCP